MRKTHLIVTCAAVSVISAVFLLVPVERPQAASSAVSAEEKTTPVEPGGPVASPPAPAARPSESVRTQLRLAAGPGDFLVAVRQLPGVESAEFDAKSSNLVITHPPDGPSAKTLAELAEQAGLVVRGEVLDLPLAMENPHLETCGSCGLLIYEQLQKKPGIRAVEVFVPVKNQLRLLVEPETNTASEIAGFLTQPRHPAVSNP